MIRHSVRAHQREIESSSKNPLRKRVIHIKSYTRGSGKPEPKRIFTRTITQNAPESPERREVEEAVDKRLAEIVEKANKDKGPYWKKISDFQLNYDGKNWKIIDSYDTGGYGEYEDCELCGHKGCRFMYVISDGKNNLTIGDECVGNYIKDLNAKDIFKKHNKRLRTMIGTVKSHRDLIVDLVMWEKKNGTNSFLTNMKRRVLNGNSLSPNMVSAIKRTISKDLPPRPVLTFANKKTDRELVDLAKKKPMTVWERDTFMPSIEAQVNKGWRLSEKQLNIVNRIISNT